jgi:hypothetical protein
MHGRKSTKSLWLVTSWLLLASLAQPSRAWFEQRPADPLEETGARVEQPGPAALFGAAGPPPRAAVWLGWERPFGLRDLDAVALAVSWPLGRRSFSLGVCQAGRELWREQLFAAALADSAGAVLAWRLGLEGRRLSLPAQHRGAWLATAGLETCTGPVRLRVLLRAPLAGELADRAEGLVQATLGLGGGWCLSWREERSALGETLGQLSLSGRRAAVEWAVAWLDGRGLRLAAGAPAGPLRLSLALWWHPQLPPGRRFGLDSPLPWSGR